jgi:hypothetical protein
MTTFPWLIRLVSAAGGVRYALGEPLVDRYLEFVAGRARPNTLRAVTFDLKTFFTVVVKDPVGVVAADVFEFLAHQRGDRSVVRLADRESGLSARTIARRLSSVSGFYAYLIARGDTPVRVNPMPRGLSTRRTGGQAGPWCGCSGGCRGSCRPARWIGWSARCARRGIGRWCWRWCWSGCAAARCWGCGYRMCRSATDGWQLSEDCGQPTELSTAVDDEKRPAPGVGRSAPRPSRWAGSWSARDRTLLPDQGRVRQSVVGDGAPARGNWCRIAIA